MGSPTNALCKVRLKLVQWFLRRRFLNFVNVILLFRFYLIVPIKFVVLCEPSGSGEEDFLNFVNVFSLFCN